MKPILFYDQDEVLNFFSEYAISQYNKDFDDDFDWRDNKSWWWDDAPKGNRDYFEKLMYSKDFFYNIRPNDEGIFYMNKLIDEGYEVYLVTYPVWHTLCAVEKVRWLQDHIPALNPDQIIMTKQKHLLAGKDRILLDDNMAFLTKWQAAGGTSVAYAHPFNKPWTNARVHSHEEFYKYVKNFDGGE